MPEPVRIRIAEIIYRDDWNIRKNAGKSAPRIVDSVKISKEALEKLRMAKNEDNQLLNQEDEREQEEYSDPELKENLGVLDLDPGASPQEIRKAYLQAIKKYHPDNYRNLPPEFQQVAEERTKQINTAYSILKKA